MPMRADGDMARALTGLGMGLAELLWPTRCAICGLPGTLLCDACTHALPHIDARDACPRCACPHGWLICSECEPIRADDDLAPRSSPFPFEAARCACAYEEGAARLIRAYKDEGERRLAAPLARLTASSVDPAWRGWAHCIAYVPASPQALRRRGFDHMALVAAELSQVTGIAARSLLRRLDARDQRGLSRDSRAENACGSLVLEDDSALPADARILLVDDVFTTGATLSAATDALLGGRASAVRALAFARVW